MHQIALLFALELRELVMKIVSSLGIFLNMLIFIEFERKSEFRVALELNCGFLCRSLQWARIKIELWVVLGVQGLEPRVHSLSLARI